MPTMTSSAKMEMLNHAFTISMLSQDGITKVKAEGVTSVDILLMFSVHALEQLITKVSLHIADQVALKMLHGWLKDISYEILVAEPDGVVEILHRVVRVAA